MNFSKKINVIEQNDLLRLRKIAHSAQGTEMVIDHQKIINFCSNDYLSLANHPQIKEALIEGVSRYGVGSGASHLVSGHSDSHHKLEEALAEHTGQPLEKINEDTERDYFLSPSEAVEYGLIDKVIKK